MRRLEYDRYGLGETGEGTGLVAELLSHGSRAEPVSRRESGGACEPAGVGRILVPSSDGGFPPIHPTLPRPEAP